MAGSSAGLENELTAVRRATEWPLQGEGERAGGRVGKRSGIRRCSLLWCSDYCSRLGSHHQAVPVKSARRSAVS